MIIRENASDIFELIDDPDGELKIYQVKSLISKTLFKFLKDKRGSNTGFHVNKNWTINCEIAAAFCGNTFLNVVEYVYNIPFLSLITRNVSWIF
ncbi:MAG: hypothetical protein LBE12_14710 [Planctomycetaceae bacterium]|nr:hypothetical protein [Planctomycetaceae bacterium]